MGFVLELASCRCRLADTQRVLQDGTCWHRASHCRTCTNLLSNRTSSHRLWGSVGRILLRLICNLCINVSAASGSASGRMSSTTRHSSLSIDFEQRNRFRFICIILHQTRLTSGAKTCRAQRMKVETAWPHVRRANQREQEGNWQKVTTVGIRQSSLARDECVGRPHWTTKSTLSKTVQNPGGYRHCSFWVSAVSLYVRTHPNDQQCTGEQNGTSFKGTPGSQELVESTCLGRVPHTAPHANIQMLCAWQNFHYNPAAWAQ